MNYPFYPYQNQMPQQMPQTMQSGFVTVHTEDEALRYPVAPGNSITFKIEGQPVVIEKTMGFSQLESPKVERFRLVREETPVEAPAPQYALADDLKRLEDELEKVKGQLPKRPVKKKEEVDDE